jgi:protein O-mannosyl-transferase
MRAPAELSRGGLVPAVALAALVIAVYLPALSLGFLNWDDDRLLLENPAVTAPDGLRRIWSTPELPEGFPNYPLVFTSYWAEQRLWGADPLGYHAVNIILHAANTALVFFLAVSLGLGWRAAWWVAALFGLHPMQVESVVWIAERKNVLSAFFYLLAFLAYQRHRGSDARGWYATSLALFAAALMSKTATVVLPLSVLLADRLRDGRWAVASLRRMAPFFLLAGLAALQTVSSEHQSIHLPLLDRPVLLGTTLWFYLAKLLLPLHLSPVYARWHIDPTSALWWLPLAGAVVAALALWRWVSDGRIAWGLGHFACTLLPVLGLVTYGFHEYSFVADRNVYLACIGPFVAIAAAADPLARRLRPLVVSALAVAVLAMAASLTLRQIPVWHDSQTLWTHVLDLDPDAWVAHNNLALVLIQRGKLDQAQEHLDTALRLYPDYPEAHNNLALVFYRRGEAQAAERECRQAVRLNPQAAEYRKNLSLALQAQGQVAAAQDELRKALRLAPADGTLHYLLGNSLAAQSGPAAALPEYQRAVELAPDLVAAQNQLGRALLALGRREEAAATFARLVRRQPTAAGARYNFAVALASLGRRDQALEQVAEALRLQPDLAAARDLAARLRGEDGKTKP